MNPNVLICSVGTEIFYRTAEGGLVPDQSWEAHLDKGWDRAAVEAEAAKYPQLKPQVCWYVCVWAGLLFVLSYWGRPQIGGANPSQHHFLHSYHVLPPGSIGAAAPQAELPPDTSNT